MKQVAGGTPELHSLYVFNKVFASIYSLFCVGNICKLLCCDTRALRVATLHVPGLVPVPNSKFTNAITPWAINYMY